MQISTLYAGLRPFGASFLIGGVDTTGTHLIEADPSGMLYEWHAYALGRGGVIANKIFKQKWKPSMAEKDAVKLAMEVILKTEKQRKENAIDMAIIDKAMKFRKLNEEEIKKALR
jgi:proteasome alpha subunit